jgi:hypothetical protein
MNRSTISSSSSAVRGMMIRLQVLVGVQIRSPLVCLISLSRGGILEGTMSIKSRLGSARVGSVQVG